MEKQAAGAASGAGTGGGTLSPDWFEVTLHAVALGAEILGAAVIVLGALVACVAAVRALMRGTAPKAVYHGFRSALARGILLGLEFLVAADIIGTVAVEPTLDNLWVLGVIVLIRTFLSFSLEVEIEGRLPWRKADGRGQAGRGG
jgi:uncharacterized membrane protein